MRLPASAAFFRKIDGSPVIESKSPPARNRCGAKIGSGNFAFSLGDRTAKELKPHFLCTYLFELATEFSSFYNLDKVMVEDSLETQNLRLTPLPNHPELP